MTAEPACTTHSEGDPPQNVYSDVYRVLLMGMYASTTLYVLGVISALLHPRYIHISPEWMKQQLHWKPVLTGLLHFDQTSLMLAATVLLILTPVTRVLVSIYAFWVDHDRKYVGVTSAVFLVIVLTVMLSRLGLT